MVLSEVAEKSSEQLLAQAGNLLILPNDWWSRSRVERRLKLKERGADAHLIGRLKAVESAINRNNLHYSKLLEKYNKVLSRIIYHSEPFIYRDLDIRSKIGPLLDEVQDAVEGKKDLLINPQVIDIFTKNDFFTYPIRIDLTGTRLSLKEIASAPDEQWEEGYWGFNITQFLTIDSKLKQTVDSFFGQDPRYTNFIKQALLFAACEQVVHPNQMIPEQLEPLAKRIRNYLDYQLGRLMDIEMPFFEKMSLNIDMAPARCWLPAILSLYTPARLGITPVSAYRLFERFTDSDWFSSFFWKRTGVLKIIKGQLQYCIKPGRIPLDLESIMVPSQDSSIQGERFWLGRFQDKRLQQTDAALKETLVDALNTYGKYIREDILRSENKRLEFKLDGIVADSLTVTCQNRDVLIFIACLNNGSKSVLEIGPDLWGKVNLYGLPVQLEGCQDRIFSNLLGPVIEFEKDKHPLLSMLPLRLAPIPSKEVSQSSYQQQTFKDHQAEPVELSVPLVPERQTTKEVVIDERVYKNLPHKGYTLALARLQKNIDDFKFGRREVYKLQGSSGVYVMKSGRQRLVFEHLGEERFLLVYEGLRRPGFYQQIGLSDNRSG